MVEFFGPLTDAFGAVQQWLFESVVQPLMFAAGMGNLLEDAYAATGWLLVGLVELAVLVAVFGPLQRWRPVESVQDRRAIRVDVLYTLIHRLGLFRVLMFFSVEPLLDAVFGRAAVAGWEGVQLDAFVAPWWPGVTDSAAASFMLYLVVFDFLDYWIHRGQHRIGRWWALHSLHHSQRQMTMWSDNRNHLLDDLLRDVIIVLTARLIGVAPAQFVAIVVLTQLVESLSHINARVHFGAWGERLLVSPRFHRAHHAIGKDARNFAVLFPVWDLLFGTAHIDTHPQAPLEPTGVRDQLPQFGARDYGKGFWSQQWLGLKRLIQGR